jgi:plasmid stability protein
MPRTTLMIDDALFSELRKRAAAQSRTIQDVANQALRAGLFGKSTDAPYQLKLEGWDGRPLPGVDLTDRDALLDLMEER